MAITVWIGPKGPVAVDYTGNDISKYEYGYVAGVLPPHYPVPAIPITVVINPWSIQMFEVIPHPKITIYPK